MAQQLAQLRLSFHPDKLMVYPGSNKQDVLGYQICRSKRWLRNDNGFRFQRKLRTAARQYRKGNGALLDFQPSVMSWIGHARHGETLGLRTAIFKRIAFSRPSGLNGVDI